MTLVGERGPELLSLPRSATIQPLEQNKWKPQDSWMVPKINIQGDVHLDGKKIGKIVWNYGINNDLSNLARA